MRQLVHRCHSVHCEAPAAFWPPPREYYFFTPPPDDVLIEVNDEADAIRMRARKRQIKKLKKARKCLLGERYRFGLSHPCSDDVKYVEGFALKTSRANRIGCIYIPCPDSHRPRFTILYSHPNGSDLSDHLVGCPSLLDVARFYRCEVYSYDYSGFGISGGTASEGNMYADIRAIYDYITIEKKVNPKNLVLYGFSIGSAATIELIRHEQERKPAGVILQSPPTSLLRVLGHWVGRKNHLENPTCCLDRCVTIDKIHEVQIPILIIHGKEDRTVPVEHGEILCQRAVTKVVPEWVPDTAHDNIENCKVVWRRVRKFVKEELKLNGTTTGKEEK
uniref:Hydrolase_4 domain-containing protein n=1 Tax=Caenorhabditis japonica TaxID=281687 RepID=A0A8R1DVK1_CAEJA